MINPPKYLIRAGWVASKQDCDWHFISTLELVRLYGIKPGQWVSDNTPIYRFMTQEEKDQLITLLPSYDGDYRLPQ